MVHFVLGSKTMQTYPGICHTKRLVCSLSKQGGTLIFRLCWRKPHSRWLQRSGTEDEQQPGQHPEAGQWQTGMDELRCCPICQLAWWVSDDDDDQQSRTVFWMCWPPLKICNVLLPQNFTDAETYVQRLSVQLNRLFQSVLSHVTGGLVYFPRQMTTLQLNSRCSSHWRRSRWGCFGV